MNDIMQCVGYGSVVITGKVPVYKFITIRILIRQYIWPGYIVSNQQQVYKRFLILVNMAAIYEFPSKISSNHAISWSPDHRISLCTDTAVNILVRFVTANQHVIY